MEFLKNQLNRIQQQLAGLTGSQRMLAGSLVVIMVMTLLWWSRYAGTADMEPVLDQSFAAEEITRVTLQLQARGIPYKVQGDRVLVAADRRSEALADLAYSQLLPADTKNAFDKIAPSSPWDTESQKRAMWNKAKEATLAEILRRFPGVSHAMVLIDTTTVRAFGESAIQPSATISLTMRSSHKADGKLVNSAADLVCGAVANLAKGRIKVIVDGMSHLVTDPTDPGGAGSDWLARVREAESYFAGKLQNHLMFIEGAMVSVTVVPNIVRENSTIQKVDPTNPLHKVIEDETSTDESNTKSTPGAESGTLPNVGMKIEGDSSGGENTSTTHEKSKNKYLLDYGRSQINRQDPGGNAVITSASVFVPRSYFARIYKQRNPSSQEPTDPILQPLIDNQLLTIRAGVKTCLGLADDSAVNVASYTDLIPVIASDVPAAASSVGLAVGGHMKEIAIGALALASLVMMSLMVRKGAAAPVVVAPQIARSTPTLVGGEEAVGEATEGSAMLDGMELDEDAVRSQQMVEQVASMVKDNPDAAANLVKRWLNRT